MEWSQILKIVRTCNEATLLKQLIIECETRIRELRDRDALEWEVEQINDTDSLMRLRGILMRKFMERG